MTIGQMFGFVLWTCAVTVLVSSLTKAGRMEMVEDVTSKREVSHRLGGFSWTTCNTTASVIDIMNLSISPDPLILPGVVNVSANYSIAKQLEHPLKAVLVLKRKVLSTTVKVPCIDNFGSCIYDDVCQILESEVDQQCQGVLQMVNIDNFSHADRDFIWLPGITNRQLQF